jgi:glucosamine--fructose-6-phosphate aminotransferase (isomerizing)
MCGIIGFLAPSEPAVPSGDELFDLLGALVSYRPGVGVPMDLSEGERAHLAARLRTAQAASYGWMLPSGFLAVAAEPKVQNRLREEAERLQAWAAGLEGAAAGARPLRGVAELELLGLLAGGAKDIAWQLEHDLLGSIGPVRALCGSPDNADPRLLGHAWQLNFLLAGIDRLEVRGRDSSGIAVYVRFPSEAALERFLDGPLQSDRSEQGDPGGDRRRELGGRYGAGLLPHLALLRPATARDTLLAVFKVASEVGSMGDNVAALRRSIAGDPLFQAALREPGVRLQALGHTRWASNGVISVPNCHPVDAAISTVRGVEGSGEILAVLNGDVDNYRDLVERFVNTNGSRIDPAITTDAKIIPLVVARFLEQTGDLAEAVRAAFDLFEGSMAIGVMAAGRPGEVCFAQKGSGQGLFFGLSAEGVAVASEMYGVVPLTPDYVKAEGERSERGEVFRLRQAPARVEIELAGGRSRGPVPAGRRRRAQITTRDINRGDSPHFLLKEIRESPESVRKTLRGRLDTHGDRVRFFLGDALGAGIVDAIRSGTIRRILPIGQGTAAVSADGVAHLLRAALTGGAGPLLEIVSLKATELSGNHLADDMHDTLIVAISQSGTTTDTNRTVDMARARGAKVVSIVNRRDSDLVYKSDGVLFTSDGRDVEMSVASTKAYYSQNVAGQILALALASELGTMPPEQILREARILEVLPDAMEKTLALEDQIAGLARRFALARSHWAVVGTGPSKIAADEVRIKLSELCYKSIANDHLEDKKHIDLSSEPLVIVCAHGIPEECVGDAVKEVAIFKAHNSIPIVVTREGEERFDPYAAGTIKLPHYPGRLAYLQCAMAGHLFGYHAAVSFDTWADRVRRVRAGLQGEGATSDDTPAAPTPELLPPPLVEQIVEIEGAMASGEMDGALRVGTATRLVRALGLLLGRFPVDVFSRMHGNWLDGVVGCLSQAISELSRPIDAIKHQAKTVTVGISRPETAVAEGPLWAALRSLELDPADIAETHRRLVTAFEPLVASVDGATLYELKGLDPLGKPTDASTIRVVTKTGVAEAIASRNEGERPLTGTKWGVVRRAEAYVGYGQTDGRKLLILPVVGERTEGYLLLYHLTLRPGGELAARQRALEARPEHLDRLRIAVTERNVAWAPELIGRVDNDILFFETPDRAAEAICRATTRS